MREQIYLRRAAYAGTVPLLAYAGLVALRPFPYPDNNRPGREYVDYIYPRHTAVAQSVISVIVVGLLLLFTVNLAQAYRERAGRTTAASTAMVTAMAAYAAIGVVTGGFYAAAGQLVRGYPGFGNAPEDFKLVTFAWVAGNTTYVLGSIPMAIVWMAIAWSNHSHPVLPRALGGWCAGAVATANLVSLGSLFIYTGPWGPGASFCLLVQGGSTYLWITATSLVLLRRPGRVPPSPADTSSHRAEVL